MKKLLKNPSKFVFDLLSYCIIIILTLACTLPFVMVISGSFSSNSAIMRLGYSIFPREFSLDGYKAVFKNPDIIGRSYVVSIIVTVVGTILGLVIMTMAGYALQRNEMKYRNAISFFVYFTTLFSGGLVPWYMLICNLGMQNTLWALIIPSCVNSFHILLIRNYMRGIPASLVESAKIDGAGEFYTFLRIILPLAQPIVATVGLFLALQYWNSWYMASLFVKESSKWPLQYRLHKMLVAQTAMLQGGETTSAVNSVVPTETLKLATAVVTTGPIVLLYPFLQKYFVQGITIGAVKG